MIFNKIYNNFILYYITERSALQETDYNTSSNKYIFKHYQKNVSRIKKCVICIHFVPVTVKTLCYLPI